MEGLILWIVVVLLVTCGRNLIQVEALECYKCDSEINPECAFWENVGSIEKTICEGEELSETCITRVTGVIDDRKKNERGCSSEIMTPEETCVEPNCKTCNTDLCNGDVFPAGRRKCYQCLDGVTCRDGQTQPKVCAVYDYKERCYFTVAADSTTERGCLSDPGKKEMCDNNPIGCVSCNPLVSACNNKPAITDAKLECYTCGIDDPLCLMRVKCQKPVRYDQIEDCYMYEKDEVVERGCLLDIDDKESPAYKACSTVPVDATCKTCTVMTCNYNALVCHLCDKTSEDCTKTPAQTPTTECPAEHHCSIKIEDDGTNSRGCTDVNCNSLTCMSCIENRCNSKIFPISRRQCRGIDDKIHGCIKVDDQCVSIFDGTSGNALVAGCLNEMTDEIKTRCAKGLDRTCQTCVGDECNSITPLQPISCYQCDKTDDTCTKTPDKTTSTQCLPGEFCVTKLEDDGSNSRGCQKEDCFKCSTCDSNNCNGVIYPSDRRLCHQCSGEACIAEQTGAPSACKFHQIEKQCYLSVVDMKTTRGCLDVPAEEADPLCPDSNTCTKCSTNGCNSKASRVASTLSCYKCTEKDEGCGPELSTDVKGQKCDSIVFLGETEQCFSHKNTTLRGCLLDIEPGTCDADVCDICDSDDCNTKRSKSTAIFASFYLVPTALLMLKLNNK